MSFSAEAVVREFLAAWSDPDEQELASFLAEDAVWVDGPNGVHVGAPAFARELVRQMTIPSEFWLEIDTLLASHDTVMVEWHGGMTIGPAPVKAKVMAVFELDGAGRIRQMRESFDMQSLVDQFAPKTPE
jgi:limonene-1,2-epoxide hydrolase